MQAGFDAVDVHMTDLLEGRTDLLSFNGLAACGGFSYGDVLGAGGGWAKTILFNERLKEQFVKFFENGNTFTLGVCNGCQMISQLKSLIPGAQQRPSFEGKLSEQFGRNTKSNRDLSAESKRFKTWKDFFHNYGRPCDNHHASSGKKLAICSAVLEISASA